MRLRLQPRLGRGVRAGGVGRSRTARASSRLWSDRRRVLTTASPEIPRRCCALVSGRRSSKVYGTRAVDLAELFSGSRQQRTIVHDSRERHSRPPGRRASAGIVNRPGCRPSGGPTCRAVLRFAFRCGCSRSRCSYSSRSVGRASHRATAGARSASRGGAGRGGTAAMRAQEDPGTAMTSVAEAKPRSPPRETPAPRARAGAPEQDLARVRDESGASGGSATSMRVGSVPAEPSEESVRLACWRDSATSWPRTSVRGRSAWKVVTLLAPAVAVDGGSDGDIRHVSVNDGHLVVSDGAATYVRDESGRWQRRPLAVADDDGLRPDTPVIAWGDAAYGLSRDGNLVRFDQASGNRSAATSGRPLKTYPICQCPRFAIDGRIHVLLEEAGR